MLTYGLRVCYDTKTSLGAKVDPGAGHAVFSMVGRPTPRGIGHMDPTRQRET